MDIYRAVLDDDVMTVSQFNNWLSDHKGFNVMLPSAPEI